MTIGHASVRVRLPTNLSQIIQGNNSDYANDHVNDHNAASGHAPITWAFDFSVPKHTQVQAVAGGIVVFVQLGLSEPANAKGWSGYGNVITVKSSDGQGGFFYTTYAHLEQSNTALVSVGQMIGDGQLIAYSGDTGSPGVSHLHIQFGSTTYNPVLNTTAGTSVGIVADGSADNISPAYFQNTVMHFDQSPNLTDRVFTGTAGTDIFYANNLGDTIVTDGGADTITLGANGHTDRVEFYAAKGAAVGGIVPAVANSIVDANDTAQGGFWGLDGRQAQFGGIVANHGTSVDMTTVLKFQFGNGAGYDVLDFSNSAWGSGGKNAQGGVNHGLTTGNLSNHPGAGTDAVIAKVSPGGTVAAAADVIELIGQQFANADAVASALHSSFKFNFAALLAKNDDAHLLVAYSDTSGNTRIADVEFTNPSTSPTANTGVMTEHASDVVDAVGDALAQLVFQNVHFIV